MGTYMQHRDDLDSKWQLVSVDNEQYTSIIIVAWDRLLTLVI